jgi:hypothetical protein
MSEVTRLCGLSLPQLATTMLRIIVRNEGSLEVDWVKSTYNMWK